MNEPPWQKGPKSIAVGCPLGIETRRRGDVIPSAIYVPVAVLLLQGFQDSRRMQLVVPSVIADW
jgi:hypothetical protein